ncbi:MAG: zf-TFIIB domain-containing protein [Deltaproteobacteria bacterium]|nr:zf-TFIIB domain-containing protein [Deltaproteobacteria bacterium]
MEAIPIAGDEPRTVDRCPNCSGVFVDYFDGDPSAIARRMADAGALEQATRPLDRDPVCPDCDQALVLLPYLDDTKPLWRCEGCAGAFLTPGMLDHLADYRWSEPQPPGLITRLLQWWRAVPTDEG